ncbi:CarboxypepD_reg-like domain-containing protein [Halpernia humi]|uniref:CarboxypepD_reg-like domain-containing protein n=1 Tax=Halpernia humi TaxID=493375 RepID=A0A1H5UCM9_9FLAO|nr:carboxypeptidase-like regulatory domain-containing protein [Halpernia humi]SEF72158.1 CarboxypepD_reg-like domain-containing protein [Halpernia humi]
MKSILLFGLFLLSQIFVAQIKGHVQDEGNRSVKGVSIYIDGSTISTLSDENGNFNLQTSIKNGNLIIKKEDYSKIIFPVKDALGKNLKVILQKEKLIEEVNLIPYNDKDFERNFSIFQYAFLGDTNSTKILNKKDLLFAVDRKNNIFRAKAKKPLIIENENLGYTIIFDLMNFEKRPQSLTYNGTSLFKEMPGNERKQNKYKKKREEAFIGSATHFFQSLYAGKTKENGFNVNLVKIISNPNYPSALEMKTLENYVNNLLTQGRNISTEAMPAHIKAISERAENPKTFLSILKTSIPESDYSFRKNNKLYLKSDNLLQIVYTTKNKKIIDTLVDTDGQEFEIFPDGYYENPDQLIFNGTWGDYKVSKMLPTNFYLVK